MKLTKADRSAIDETLSNPDWKIDLSFADYIRQLYEEGQEFLARKVVNTREHLHPDWPDEWIEKNCTCTLLHWNLHEVMRGVARRFINGDVGELALHLQMFVRYAALGHQANESEYIDIWRLLPALAIDDNAAVERFVELATFPIVDSHPDVRVIYNGVHAILRSDDQELEKLRAFTVSKQPAWLGGMIVCLQGIADIDPSRVATGHEQHLAGFRRSFRSNQLEKIISFEAHGLYRLAQRVNPDLVQDIDTQRGLPWDREFHAWTTNNKVSIKLEHFPNWPKELASVFVDLVPVPWLP